MRAGAVWFVLLVGVGSVACAAGRPGGRLAFVREGEVVVCDAGGGEARVVAKGLPADGVANWSADGKEVLFWRQTEGWDVWAVGADGAGLRRVTKVGKGGGRGVVASPDGKRIAFVRDAPAGLFVADREGGNEVLLARDAQRSELPVWSPDGRWVVYGAFTMGDDSDVVKVRMDLWVVGVDGEGRRRLTHAEGSSDGAAWAPDGRRVYFCGARGGNSEVCAVEVESGREERVTRTKEDERDVRVSGDGRLAFWRGKGLWVIEGGKERKVVEVEGPVGAVAWSGDGEWLAYGGEEGVWVVELGSGEVRRVAERGGVEVRVQGSGFRVQD